MRGFLKFSRRPMTLVGLLCVASTGCKLLTARSSQPHSNATMASRVDLGDEPLVGPSEVEPDTWTERVYFLTLHRRHWTGELEFLSKVPSVNARYGIDTLPGQNRLNLDFPTFSVQRLSEIIRGMTTENVLEAQRQLKAPKEGQGNANYEVYYFRDDVFPMDVNQIPWVASSLQHYRKDLLSQLFPALVDPSKEEALRVSRVVRLLDAIDWHDRIRFDKKVDVSPLSPQDNLNMNAQVPECFGVRRSIDPGTRTWVEASFPRQGASWTSHLLGQEHWFGEKMMTQFVNEVLPRIPNHSARASDVARTMAVAGTPVNAKNAFCLPHIKFSYTDTATGRPLTRLFLWDVYFREDGLLRPNASLSRLSRDGVTRWVELHTWERNSIPWRMLFEKYSETLHEKMADDHARKEASLASVVPDLPLKYRKLIQEQPPAVKQADACNYPGQDTDDLAPLAQVARQREFYLGAFARLAAPERARIEQAIRLTYKALYKEKAEGILTQRKFEEEIVETVCRKWTSLGLEFAWPAEIPKSERPAEGIRVDRIEDIPDLFEM